MVKPLINGFQNFRDNYFSKEKSFFENLIKKGQKPKVMIISCSDSRVDPAILFNAKPGELFVVRNVANLVPPYEPDEGYHGVSAAIEYATKDLLVEHIVVLGHAFCGGISALCEICKNEKDGLDHGNSNKREFLESWIKISKQSILELDFKNWPGSTQHLAERKSIINSINNLMTFPWVSELVSNKKLELHGWWFNLENSSLWNFNHKNKCFEELVPK